MPTITQRGAGLDFALAAGDDFTQPFTAPLDAVVYSWTGATVTSAIVDQVVRRCRRTGRSRHRPLGR